MKISNKFPKQLLFGYGSLFTCVLSKKILCNKKTGIIKKKVEHYYTKLMPCLYQSKHSQGLQLKLQNKSMEHFSASINSAAKI